MVNHHVLAILAGFLTIFAVYVRSPMVALPAVILMFYYFVLAILDVTKKLSGQAEEIREERKQLAAELGAVQKMVLEKTSAVDPRLAETTAKMLIEAALLSRQNDLPSLRHGRTLVAEVRNRIGQ